MNTELTEIASGIFRISTYIPPADLRFNQYLILADEPLLFHCGMRGLFPGVSAAVARIMPVENLRWISYGHHEADESGAMNEWLNAAPRASIALGEVGIMLSAMDQAIRPPRPLQDNEVLDLGGKKVRYLYTPHVPHCWDAGLMYEETTRTFLCGDLFTTTGDTKAETEDDILEGAFAAEEVYGATSLTPSTAPTLRRLAELQPATLALMHGPAFHGDGKQALLDLAAGSERRLQSLMK